MKNLQTVEHDFPIYWNTYIMYGDSSGLEDGEQEIIDEILKELELTNCVDIKDNQYFTWIALSYAVRYGETAQHMFFLKTWETWENPLQKRSFISCN